MMLIKNFTQTTKVFIRSGISLFAPQLTAVTTKKFLIYHCHHKEAKQELTINFQLSQISSLLIRRWKFSGYFKI